MSDDLNTEIKIGADASGVEAGVGRAKRSLADLGNTAKRAGQDASSGVSQIGVGSDKAARQVETSTRSMVSSLQRVLAQQQAGSKTSREYYEALADSRGVNRNAIKPILDQIDAAKAKTLQAKAAADSWHGSLGRIGPALVAAFAGAAAYGFTSKIVAVQREFDILNSSLKTVTGSSEAAQLELAWLKDFAKETPFGLAQATQGFVKMKALGLDPTRAALTSFGNTASAMGKDLNQMIEAVADASTGEFERLKEFGIKASKQGDQVSLTFQGITKTIGNSAAEITRYLEDIGNTQFAGAMEERAKTLDGTLAALGDTWDELFRTVSSNNVGGLIFDTVTLANGAIEDATTVLKAYSGATQDAAGSTGALVALRGGAANFFETVAVLAANTLYVLKQTGDTLAGVAAGYTEFFKFNFEGVREIGRQMRENGEAARREIDATTERILNARKEQERYLANATRNASAATDPRRVDLTSATSSVKAPKVDAAAIKAANRELEQQANLLATLAGNNADYQQQLTRLVAIRKIQNLSDERYIELVNELISKQPAVKKMYDDDAKAAKQLFEDEIRSADLRAKALAELEKTMEDYAKAQSAGVASSIDEANKAEEQLRNYGLLKSEVHSLTLAYLQQSREIAALAGEDVSNIEKRIEAQKRLITAVQGLEQREATDKAAKQVADEWKKTADSINDDLTDALLRGFESGKDFAKNFRDTLVNMFKTLVLRPIISGVVTPVAGGITNALGVSGTAGSALQTASNLNSLYGAGSQALYGGTAGASALSLGYANAVGAVGGDALGALITANGGWAAAGTTGISGALSAVPIWGWIAAAAVLLGGTLFGKKLENAGVQGSFGGATGFEGENFQYYKGALLSNDKFETSALAEEARAAMGDAFIAMRQQVGGFADALGLESERLAAFTQSVQIDTKGLSEAEAQGAIAAALASANDALAAEVLGSWVRTTEQVKRVVAGGFGRNDETYITEITETVKTATYTASEFARSGEKAIDTLTRLAGSLTTVNAAWDVLGFSMVDASLAGGDAASKLLDVFGGIENFQSATASYFDNFYSESEKIAAATKQVTTALAAIGLEVPTTRDGFRELVNEQQALGESGNTALVALLNLQGVFAGITESSDAAAQALAAREKVEADAAAKLIEDLATAFDSAMKNVAGTRFDLENELLVKTGRGGQAQQRIDAAALSALTAGLPEDLAAQVAAEFGVVLDLRGQITALDDLAAASTKAQQAELALVSARANAAQSAYIAAQSASSAALSSVERAADTERALIEGARSAANELAQDLASVIETLADNARSLYGDVSTTARLGAAAGVAFIDDALRNAKATGYLPDADGLSNAITAARSGSSYATQFDQDRDRLSLAAKLSDLADIAQPQLTAAEAAAAKADEQLKALDTMLANARDQLDAMRGIDTSVKTIPEALAALQAAMVAESQAQTNALAAALINSVANGTTKPQDAVEQLGVARDQWTDVAGTQTWLSGGGAIGIGAGDPRDTIISSITGAQFSAGEATDFIDAALASGDLRSIYDAAIKHGISSASLDALKGWTPGTSLKWALDNGLPAFAGGGSHAGGLRMVGEKGWEVEATGPARYWNQSQLSGALGGSELAGEIRALREDNREQAGAIVRLNARVAKLLEKWDGEGMPGERVEALA